MHFSFRGFFGGSMSLTFGANKPKPAALPATIVQEYELERFFVAGFQHHYGPSMIFGFEPGGLLQLVREPWNPHDPRAVALVHQGHCIGYVPRVVNAPIARLLDQNAPLACRIVYVDPDAKPWKAVDAVITIKGAKAMG